MLFLPLGRNVLDQLLQGPGAMSIAPFHLRLWNTPARTTRQLPPTMVHDAVLRFPAAASLSLSRLWMTGKRPPLAL